METKKYLRIIVSAILCFGILISLFVPISANAASSPIEDFYYYEDNGEIIITCYTGAGGIVTIPSEIDGKPVTGIGGYAFENCYELKSVVIPNSITSIGAGAFFDCSGLTSVIIPNSITSISYNAFSGCTGLTSITLSDSIKNIDDSAFYGCSNLTAIALPQSVISIGSGAFYDCTGLKNITIGDGVEKIGSSAFENTQYYNNNSNWDNNLLYINNYLIGTRESISGSCIIKQGTKLIAGSAFYECESLSSITIPDSVTSIGNGAFYGCTGLTNVTIPDSVTSIGSGAFNGCVGLKNITVSDCVTSLSDYVFYGCTGLTSITIPDSVTSIGKSAFYGCTGLTSITIPDSVTSIGISAFRDCTGLTSITIPDSVTSIGISAFRDCTGLTSITIPDSVTQIADGAFRNTGYYNNNANWENGVLYIGNHLIEAKDDLSGSYSIKSGTKTISPYAFSSCENLTAVSVPDSVTQIAYGAFWRSSNLSDISIPNTLESIGGAAFYQTAYYNDTSNWSQGSLIMNGNLIKVDQSYSGTYEVGEGINLIADEAMLDCGELDSVIIPEGIKKIGDQTFALCPNLSSLYLPKSLRQIGYGVLRETDGLNDIYYSGTERDKEQIEINTGISIYGDSLNKGFFTATWHYNEEAPTLYTLTYNVNGGNNGPSAQSGSGKVKISSSKPQKSGYTFLGWSASAAATAAQYQPGDEFNLSANITLYAVWKQNPVAPTTYTLIYNANGGAGAPLTKTGYGSITLSAIKPVRDDYTFLGWATSSSATTAQYQPGASFNLTSDITLYAVWQKVNTPVNPSNPDNPGDTQVIPNIAIKNYSSSLSVDYKSKVTFHTTIKAPSGYEIVWQDGTKGSTYTINQATQSEYKIQAKLVRLSDGQVVRVTQEETVTVNTGFFARIIAFFRGLFGALPEYVDNTRK